MSQPILVLRVLALDYCFVLRTLFLDLTGVRLILIIITVILSCVVF